MKKKQNENLFKLLKIQTVLAERNPRSHADSVPVGGTKGRLDGGT
jgi:hypothetical protein